MKKMQNNKMRSKKMAAVLAALLSAGMLLGGCGAGGEDRLQVGVVQISENPSLDTIREAFLQEMEALGYGEDRVEYDIQNAQGDQSNLNTICSKFLGDQVDLVVAIATPTAQTAATNLSSQIPVLFSAVSDPVSAKLVQDPQHPEGNVTGTSDAIPVEQVLQLCKTLTPDVQKIGFLYTSGEINSQVTVEKAQAAAQEMGYDTQVQTISEISELQQAAQSLAAQVDAIYTPIDNTIATSMPVLSRVGTETGTPIYVGADSMVEDGGLATVGIEYGPLGQQTAQMAVQILEGTPVSDIPVQTLDSFSTIINESTAQALGITIPEELAASARIVG